MTADLMLPSQALNRRFELSEAGVEPNRSTATVQPKTFTSHAFSIGNIGLLIPRAVMSEVSEDLSLCRLPNTPAWLPGMANLRGNIVPVFDLYDLMDIHREATHDRKVLIIGIKEEAVGLLIDELPTRVTLTTQDRLAENPPLPGALQPFVRACYLTDQIWVDWDVDGFFSSTGERI